jgi:hypothetical protein
MTQAMHEIDQDKLDAYVKSIEADKLLAAGRLEDARLKMGEAAALDGTYFIRAELIGKEDTGRIRVSATVSKLLVPFLLESGFEVQGGGCWREGKFLNRHKSNVHGSLLIGRDKFGCLLCIGAARWRDPARTEHFDWRTVGIRSGCLAYKTQGELEAACARWCELISLHLFPWLDSEIGS